MPDPHQPAQVVHRDAGKTETTRAARSWWDADADDYQAEHGAFLGGPSGGAEFLWCPEGVTEARAQLLGDTSALAASGAVVLEVGCGAAQCARWLRTQGVRAVGLDLSVEQLRHGQRLDAHTGVDTPVAVADAQHLPVADGSIDVVASAFGAIPFVADSAGVMAEIARVLRPGGRAVFSVTHPLRWVFPDDPGPAGLTVRQSYFDRTPYVEVDAAGAATYVEHHRTLGDRVRELVAAGLVLQDLVEPEWDPELTQEWGQWSPLRGALIPGTAIFVAAKPS